MRLFRVILPKCSGFVIICLFQQRGVHMAYRARIRDKSGDQNENCKYPGCNNKATHEAVCEDVVVPCCDKEAHKLHAIKTAVDDFDGDQFPGFL